MHGVIGKVNPKMIVLCGGLLFASSCSWGRTVIVVLDASNGLPINDVTVTGGYGGFQPQGQIETRTYGGVASFSSGAHLSDGPLGWFTDWSITLQKSGYHSLRTSSRYEHGFGIYMLRLKPIKHGTTLIAANLEFIPGDRVDLLSALENPENKNMRVLPREYTGLFDFTMTGLGDMNSASAFAMHVSFEGDGGVQRAFKDDNADERNTNLMEQLTEAPSSGYSKEMDLSPEYLYVARLRDGKHYMKLIATSRYPSRARFKILAQPEPIRNLESGRIISPKAADIASDGN
jgi:hypothetical protein